MDERTGTNLYLPPDCDGPGPTRRLAPSARVYAWISIGLGLAAVGAGMNLRYDVEALINAWIEVPAERRGVGINGEALPALQAGLMKVMAAGILEADPRVTWLERIFFAMSAVLPRCC